MSGRQKRYRAIVTVQAVVEVPIFAQSAMEALRKLDEVEPDLTDAEISTWRCDDLQYVPGDDPND